MARGIRIGWLGCAGFLLALVLPAAELPGFDTFGDGYGSKWDDPNFGTGAAVYWSYVTPGAGLSSEPAIADLSGVNTLGGGDPAWGIRYKMDAQFGAGAFDAAVQRAFDTWSRVANLRFVQVADSGAPFAGSTTPDIGSRRTTSPKATSAAVRPGARPATTSSSRTRSRAIWRSTTATGSRSPRAPKARRFRPTRGST